MSNTEMIVLSVIALVFVTLVFILFVISKSEKACKEYDKKMTEDAVQTPSKIEEEPESIQPSLDLMQSLVKREYWNAGWLTFQHYNWAIDYLNLPYTKMDTDKNRNTPIGYVLEGVRIVILACEKYLEDNVTPMEETL